VAWGYNHDGQCDVPAPDQDFVAVAAGGRHSLGLKSDGTITAWGSGLLWPVHRPSAALFSAPAAGFVAIAAGTYLNLGVHSQVVRVFLSSLSVSSGDGGFRINWSVSWRVEGHEFRLAANQGSERWEIPFQYDGNGRFCAFDTRAGVGGGQLGTYSLSYRQPGRDWILLAE
jgi:hypothetical protein